MTSTLHGEIAVVTGGASGIGRACAYELATRGATVVIVDRDTAMAEEVIAGLPGAGRHRQVRVDVTDADDITRAAEQVAADVGDVSVLVTSAGIAQRPTSPILLPVEEWDAVMRTNVRGTWLCAAVFGTAMARRGRGSVVTIASITGFRSTPLHAYGSGKAAIVQMTTNLAGEWGRRGVRVNGVAPGYTRTPMLQARIDSGERDRTALEETSALGRLVEPAEVARVVAFLAGPEASAITGVTIPVDAGWLVAPSWQTYGGVPTTQPAEAAGV
jgi:NAD(P)-dependent dehydrogenase (short-subunit alcohol dehydrogenase family)